MRIVLDTNVLVQALRNAKDGIVLVDPATGKNVDRAETRAEALVEQIDVRGGTVLIPTPVLAEYLVGVERSHHQQHLDIVNGVSCFEIVAFDQIAAVECARMVDDNELKVLDPDAIKAKLRFDRQIIAIALANNADEIWTHDKGLYKKAQRCGLVVKCLADIEPNPQQLEADLGQ
ncbi:type II toxin-antitoxin system VapC family toxin [Pseudomonas sp. CNPSo 3701]|uniref:type II toxin-antitoxin system VapC family toxin n=1 Tax=Pseudomonas sp. CNPSo 3701 TaxID=3027943 RepID=UPI0023643040|nr:PIN domain-containing protein [Pseudomonas sp. CNPSo 3701]MDD1509300.1 PIN domain-containing protein [Pseudomonas sp. CNPSo 3701]